jgi:hypothetical protein
LKLFRRFRTHHAAREAAATPFATLLGAQSPALTLTGANHKLPRRLADV